MRTSQRTPKSRELPEHLCCLLFRSQHRAPTSASPCETQRAVRRHEASSSEDDGGDSDEEGSARRGSATKRVRQVSAAPMRESCVSKTLPSLPLLFADLVVAFGTHAPMSTLLQCHCFGRVNAAGKKDHAGVRAQARACCRGAGSAGRWCKLDMCALLVWRGELCGNPKGAVPLSPGLERR